ncbi:RHS repeat-associated core domain-containing protein [Lysobacter sp. K5869]|uniref:RHS repeat domain-containing protein n=1 Tax=Lysobacter sp. K5869 TaxID=2820808 RepID=UPI002101575A|nr:RHS repeat-associated core domain-containing protein [Lysobacter sp. K5869]
MKKAAAGFSFLSLLLATHSGLAQTTIEYVHTDALGSPVAVTDAAQNVVERLQYEPYGWTLDAVVDGPGYTGHLTDAATGLVYMQQRYYDASMGIFLSIDPVTALAAPLVGFNRYRYALSNPYGFKDPDGRWVCNGESCAKFEKALERVVAAASNPRLTDDQRGVMRQVVSFYGPKGDANVRVSFNESMSTDGSAAMRKSGGHDIQFNMSRLSHRSGDNFIPNFARQTAHEGQHGVDDMDRRRPVATLAERKATEVNSYRAAAIYQKADQVVFSSVDGWTPWGGVNEQAIRTQADLSVAAACRGVAEGSCQ